MEELTREGGEETRGGRRSPRARWKAKALIIISTCVPRRIACIFNTRVNPPVCARARDDATTQVLRTRARSTAAVTLAHAGIHVRTPRALSQDKPRLWVFCKLEQVIPLAETRGEWVCCRAERRAPERGGAFVRVRLPTYLPTHPPTHSPFYS